MAWWGQPQGQLMEMDLSLPQAPGEMTQLPVIKAEPQEVNQFLKVTPGKCVQKGTLPLSSLEQTASPLPWLSPPISLDNSHLSCEYPFLPALHTFHPSSLLLTQSTTVDSVIETLLSRLLTPLPSFTNGCPLCSHLSIHPLVHPPIHPMSSLCMFQSQELGKQREKAVPVPSTSE